MVRFSLIMLNFPSEDVGVFDFGFDLGRYVWFGFSKERLCVLMEVRPSSLCRPHLGLGPGPG